MNNDIVQLTDKNGNNVFPIAGAATQDSISKSMLEEGVFEGTELFPAPSEAYVRTENIVDGAVTPAKITSATYRTTEQVVGTWIDGKPLYRKTIDIGTLPNNAVKTIQHNISDIQTVVSLRGYANNGGTFMPIPQSSTSSSNGSIRLACDLSGLYVATNVDYSNNTGYVTLEYTKTTD